MSKYTLTYFDLRGRGEIVRLVFAAAGKEFVDNRITADNIPMNEEWQIAKKKAPFGQAPFIERDDGFVLANSLSIARFLANEFDLAGKGSLERAEVDMYVEAVGEMINNLVEINLELSPDRLEILKKKFFESQGRANFSVFEVKIASSESGYIVGDSLTLADLCVFDLRSFVESVLPAEGPFFLGPFANCKLHSERVAAEIPIAAWLLKRPKTDL